MEALGSHGRLIADLIPELKLIIGEQGPVPELPPQHAQSRFQRLFKRFIGVFARPEHPLVLFLDDLQWLDAATLDLLEDLLEGTDLNHLMLIGAYRDNEVDAAHPLMRMLDAIKSAGETVTEITLVPLGREHLGQLLADALRCWPKQVAPLAELVLEKTAGNPFFAIQFIFSLAEEGLLAFDHDAARWSWDLDRIHAKRYTDNVVDLMLGKLTRLPAATQTALQQMACLGNVAETAMLSMVLAAEAGPHGIRVNAIAPGATITNFSQRHLYDEQGNVSQEKFDAFVERMKGFSPLNIVGEAMDQALLILYLVSPAGRYATGNIFRVNGGQAMAW